jgi:hypothetical protein
MSKAAKHLVAQVIMKDVVRIENGINGKGLNPTKNSENGEPSPECKHAKYWVNQLSLKQHPFMDEAYFKETFIDPQMVQIKKDSNEDNRAGGVDEILK